MIVVFVEMGNWIYIQGGSMDLVRAMNTHLRYQPKGYFWSEKYADGTWDGWSRLFQDKQMRFPAGLLKEGVAVARSLGFDVRYECRTTTSFMRLDKVEIEMRPGLVPYEYEIEAADRYLEGRRGMVCLPTGTGKSLVALLIMCRLKLSTLILVGRKELMMQWRNKIALHTTYHRRDIGMIGGGAKVARNTSPISIGMVQTLHKYPGLISQFEFAIFDESHHTSCDTIYSVAMKAKSARYFLGLTATPEREDGADMKVVAAVGPIIYRKTYSEMIQQGFLARPVFRIFNAPRVSVSRRDGYPEVYSRGIVNNIERNKIIAEEAMLQGFDGKRVYIHVTRIDHGNNLARLIPGASWVHANSKDRFAALARFRSEGGILISTLLGEGVDIPQMNTLILSCGGKSIGATIQIIGRVLRITRDKPTCEIIDFVDPLDYLHEHSMERIKWYSSESEFKIVKED